MANKFWIAGGTGTWSNSAPDDNNWSTSSGGANNTTHPTSSDVAIFDGSSGGGTVTVNANISVLGFTWGTFTGTIDFSANNNTMTIGTTGFSGTGTGARKLLMGSGAWTLNGSTTPVWSIVTTTNLDAASVFTAPVTVNLTTTALQFFGGGKSWGAWTISCTLSGSQSPFFSVEPGNAASNTFASLSLANAHLQLRGGQTQTITGAFTWVGTSSHPMLITSDNISTTRATIAAGAASTAEWCAFRCITVSTNTVTATNSFDLSGNSGTISISAPTGGTGGIVIGS